MYPNISTFVSPIYTSSLVGNIYDYTPIRVTIREKEFNQYIHKGKKPTPALNKHLSFRFFLHRPHFPIFRQSVQV